jgi:HEPN domain-containing protein
VTLAQSYLVKAEKRMAALRVLMQEEAYSDVVREAQEVVELALKGMLRQIGVEPPKQHDVGALLLEHRDRLPKEVHEDLPQLAKASKWLRKEREFSFYGADDFVPTDEYGEDEARAALLAADLAVRTAARVIPSPR